MTICLGASCAFQLWHAFSSKMYGRQDRVELSLDFLEIKGILVNMTEQNRRTTWELGMFLNVFECVFIVLI